MENKKYFYYVEGETNPDCLIEIQTKFELTTPEGVAEECAFDYYHYRLFNKTTPTWPKIFVIFFESGRDLGTFSVSLEFNASRIKKK